MKKKIITGLSLLIVAILLMSHSAGITDRTGAPGETTCGASSCHTSFAVNSGGGNVTITSNISPGGYVPGQTYSISVVVTKTLVPLFGFDFEAVSPTNTTAGNITVTDAASTYTAMGSVRQNITHKSNGGLSTSSKSFNFNWTAPSSNIGNIKFYATGVAANKNNNDIGDYVYTASLVISPAALITGNINGGPFCAGSTGISIPFTAAGSFSAGNVFTAQLSDNTGSFASPTAIGSLTGTASNTIVSTVPLPSIAGTGYRVRVIASSPTTTGTSNNSNLIINLPPTTANAGPNQSVCATSATFAANAPTSGSGLWTLLSGAGTIASPTNPASPVSGLGIGNNIFQWSITSAGCSTSTSTVSVYSSVNSVTANAAADQTVCTNFATLTGNSPSPGTGLWSLVSGSGTISSPSSATTTVINLGPGTNVFKWTITNSPCSPTSDNVNITFSGSISISNAGADQTVCATSATLAGNTPTAGTGMWSLVSGTGTIANPSNPSSAVTALGTGTNVFRWTISNGACTPSYDDVMIKSASVTPANAGTSQSICATSTTLSANNPVYGTGTWSVISGGASLSASTTPFTNVSGLTPGNNTFVWTISNAPCSPSSSTVVITQAGSITSANAGPDQAVCGSSVTLAGNTATVGTGGWTLISGAGIIITPSSPTTAVTSLGTGTNVFRWTITNGGCTPSIDDVVITSSSVSIANAGPNQSICNASTTLAGNAPVYGTGTWSLISGTGTIVAPNNPSTTITGLGNGSNVFSWIISNPPCLPSVSQVTVTNCAGSILTTNSVSPGPYCSNTGYNVMVGFTTSAVFTGFYTAELSDAAGSFTNPVAIGSAPGSPISAVIPAGTNPGTGYRIRVTNSNPYTIGSDNGSNISINTCNPNSIVVDSLKGSPFCANTAYTVAVPYSTTGSFTGAFIAELSDSSGNFLSPVTIGYNYSSPILATIPSAMTAGYHYRIRVKNSSSIIVSSANNTDLQINTCPVGFNELSLFHGLAIYPNPTDGIFFVDLKNTFTKLSVSVENIFGQLVYEKDSESLKAGSSLTIDLSAYPAGLYILKVESGNEKLIRRIVKY